MNQHNPPEVTDHPAPDHQPIRSVEVQVSQPKVKQSRDKAQYVRQQKGHSWLLHWIVLGPLTLFIVPIYYSFSPNHYWHI